jgi:hypothetical protein
VKRLCAALGGDGTDEPCVIPLVMVDIPDAQPELASEGVGNSEPTA